MHSLITSMCSGSNSAEIVYEVMCTHLGREVYARKVMYIYTGTETTFSLQQTSTRSSVPARVPASLSDIRREDEVSPSAWKSKLLTYKGVRPHSLISLATCKTGTKRCRLLPTESGSGSESESEARWRG